MLRQISQWVIYSSQDPQKISLTLKAGLPFLMLLGASKYVSLENATGIIDGLVALFVLAGQFVAGAIATLGLIRKIYNTATNNLTIG